MYRNYLAPHADSTIRMGEGSEPEERRQVLGFVLEGESRLKLETLVATFRELAGQMGSDLSPNLLVGLDGYLVGWGNISRWERRETRQEESGRYGVRVYRGGPEGWHNAWSAETATHVGGSEGVDAFRLLVRWIRQGTEPGRTSLVRSFDRYIEETSPEASRTKYCIPKAAGTSPKSGT